MRINGAHESHQAHLFNLKTRDCTGKSIITVPPAKPSKMGRMQGGAAREYGVTVLNKRELQQATSAGIQLEIDTVKKMTDQEKGCRRE